MWENTFRSASPRFDYVTKNPQKLLARTEKIASNWKRGGWSKKIYPVECSQERALFYNVSERIKTCNPIISFAHICEKEVKKCEVRLNRGYFGLFYK